MITIISGEPYQAHQYLIKLRAQKGAEGFEFYSLDAEELGDAFSRTLADLLSGQTLFKRRKFVAVRIHEAKVAREFLQDHETRVGDNTLLFYAPGEKSFALKHADVETNHFAVPNGSSLKAFIASELAKRNIKQASSFVSELFSSLSRQLSTLYPVVNEIEKYALAREHYPMLAVRDSQQNPFGITDAFAKKDIKRIVTVCEKQFQEGEKPFDILTRIIWQLRVLLLVRDNTLRPEGYTLSLHPFVIKKAREALRTFWGSELEAVFLEAIFFYERILFSSLPSELLLSQFLLKISHE